MEIIYLDPLTYAAVADHEIRQAILTKLFKDTYDGTPIVKQDLADSLGLKYQQLVYQLTNHLKDFWTVVDEEKIRGATKEYIAPADPHAVYICLGKNGRIYMVDPIAEIYGPLSEKGLRCDTCSVEEADHCMKSLISKGIVQPEIGTSERETLSVNRRSGMRPLDRGIIESLKGIASNNRCILTIPCERCTFMQRKNLINVQ